TFMGEELASIDALQITLARIAAGQSDIALVGGSYNSGRPDVIMLFEFGGYCLKGEFRPVWEREDNAGFAMGSLGAFVVLESRPHAEARNARPIARLSAVASGYANRSSAGTIERELGRLWPRVAGTLRKGHAAVISGATGAAPATTEEKRFLATH